MAQTGLTIRIPSRRVPAGGLRCICTVASLLALLAVPAAGEEISVAKVTVEEARLPRLAGTDIPYEALTDKLGPPPLHTDPVILSEFGTRLPNRPR